jgi:hypothetical protein
VHESALPEVEDPIVPPMIGPPMIGPAGPSPDGRNQALAGVRGRKDGLGTLSTWPTLTLRAG